ncbi:MAG: PAS domain-containing protein [Actinobacteria bacterium]|nr:MAG: PAS domain-containing protein [Actinomycetota bacterium]
MAPGTSRVVHVRISLLAPPVTARPGGPRLGVRPFLTPDAVAVRVAARIRVAVAIGVAATGSFLPHVSGRRASLLLLLGLLWLPWSCIVLFAADRAGNDLAFFGGPIGDVLALFAVQALAPVSAPTVLLGYLIVIAFALYTGGRSLAAFLGSAALGLTAIASAYAPGDERLSSAALVPFSAAVVALVFLLDRTITLQRQATARSERLQGKSDAILARVADGVVVTDGSSRVLQCNPAAHRIVGRGQDVIGRSCVDVLGLHVGERALDCSSGCPLMVAGAGPDADLGEEVWRYGEGGRRQPLLANASAVAGPDGTVAEVVHSLRDVTRLKQAEEAKTLFLATASHELRTPLTVIAGFASTLLSDPEPDTRFLVDALTAIARRAEELNRIVDRLLLSSRIEAGRVEVVLEPVSIEAILRERLHALATATGRIASCEIEPDLPRVSASEDAVTTVVDHLFENAVKYSPEGGLIEVTARALTGWVEIRVRDHGIGMDREQAKHCFDKFWQAESTAERRFGGTGIGLYIVFSLVEAMGGRVEVESTHGEGTTFVVTLRQATDVDRASGIAESASGVGEPTSIREFMRQIGVPERSAP